MPELSRAWDDLDDRFKGCLSQAWEALIRGGLPVGAVVADGARILSAGRNHVYDERGGADALQRTPIAHAEMNALASVPDGSDFARCRIWSTHRPCSMCQAAIDFIGMEQPGVLASDPSTDDLDSPWSGDASPIWVLAANILFLHNVAQIRGSDSQTVVRNAVVEPEAVGMALMLVERRTVTHLAEGKAPIGAGLAAIWDDLVEVEEARRARLDA